MNLTDMITIVGLELEDVNVNYTQTGVSKALNEGQRLVALLTLCYEKHTGGSTWSAVHSTEQKYINVPTDCIVPLYVRDKVSGKRVHAAKIQELEMVGSAQSLVWWNETGTEHQYYFLFNPSWNSGVTTDTTNYSIRVYPAITSLMGTAHRLDMVYAADPPKMVLGTSTPKVPPGFERALIDWAMFLGTVRQENLEELSTKYIESFFTWVGKLNDVMKSRYPEGRDFEPEPIEDILERVNPRFVRERRERRG